MSLIQLNSCEGGTNTTVISTANSGGKSGTAFGTIGSSPTFSNTHTRGGMAALCDTGVGAASTWVGQGNFAANYTGSGGQFFSRFYGYCPAVPALNQYIWHTQDNAAVRMVAMRHVTSTGAFGFYDSSGTQYAGAAGGITIPLGQFFRFDIRVVPLSSGGIIEWWLFTGANLENSVGGTADDHKTVTGLAITGNGALNQLSYGPRGTVAASYQMWVDDMGTSDAAWLGSSLADAEPLPFGGISVPTQIGVGSPLRIHLPDPLGLQTPLAPPKSNTFNTGADGTTMTTGNTGGANGDAFQSFVLSSTFNTQRHHASGGCAAVPSIVGGQGGGFAWTLLGLLTTPLFVRCYVWLDAYPLGNNATIFRVANGSNVVIGRVKVNTTGFMVGSDGVSTGTPGTVKLALGQWTRIEACFTPDPDGTLSGSTEWRLFNNAEAPLDQWDDRVVFSSRPTGASIDRLAFGWDVSGQSPSDNVTWYYDDVGMSQQGWLGPTQAPPIVVSGDAGSTPPLVAPIPRIGIGPLLQLYPTPGDYASAIVPVVFSVPVATATADQVTPLLQSTHAPPAAAATADQQAPVLMSQHVAPAAAAVAAGPLPALLSTHAPPVALATAAGIAPAVGVTFAAPVAQATAAAPQPSVSIPVNLTQDAVGPLALLGGLITIPGSMAILKPQDWGDPLGVQPSLFVVPTAQVSAAGLAPALLDTYAAALATASAAGMTPVLAATLSVAVAQATAAGPQPALFARYSAPLAAAQALGLVALVRATYGPPAALATAFAFAPTVAGIGIAASGIVIRRTGATGLGGADSALGSSARIGRASSALSVTGASGLRGTTDATGTSGETST